MVNYITFRQTKSVTYANLSPNASGCHTDFTPVGEANNWECVDDPIATPDEDSTYVYSSATIEEYDLYSLPNHTTETGTINFVQIFGRAKSYPLAQHSAGIYKLLITDNACTNIYESDDMDIGTYYTTYNEIWTVNPRTGEAFTWDDLDNLQIGVKCSSLSVSYLTEYLTIRPIGDATPLQLTPVGEASTWECIDEAGWGGNGYTDYLHVVPSDNDFYSLCSLDDHTTETGIITNVAVFACVNPATTSLYNWVCTAIHTHGTTYFGANTYSAADTWSYVSTDYATNPFTSAAWTWDEIDDLLGGVKLHANPDTENYCTQIYIVVSYYSGIINPEIRTTQCYAKVNYTHDCLMIAPKEVSTDHAQNVREMNLWNGHRVVFGESRNKWSLLLKGEDWETNACEKISCIQQLGLDGFSVDVSGLNNINWDSEWMIQSFGWKLITEKPVHYEWMILLEKT